MKEVIKDWKNIKLKAGDVLVVYRGTAEQLTMNENSVVVKGNIKRDKRAKEIFRLIVDQY